ncbi:MULTISPECIES: DUF366 family protein [Carboxydocella]|uniref:DUF366 domain-containing protein n=2 Tax=Carboxydocella TaxID=178898 RepID=A0A1T4LPH9_9FIRM|nr:MULTISPECIES: DUF366 family protein [Carboxydocella]AVX20541.1 hypothetical protein CFE_1352 [Carboxydocella thermautotrophica]AVX30963.1 hypothetical protein CTH_1373 [Carboxydocella thermautotrophica]SJZ56374.1 hypothetical protein SAMN02745885_00231 [Carboxydocella sporoproducens DSM 16521]GAW29641.1 hypothetical protein ULO1_22110 [Carboxydocella sp. ULO1]GAW31467.1 hypothetical protein JDF658_12320 [Carboxydocella sp. JDF658]
MKTYLVKHELTYNGEQLSSLFAYRNFRVQGDSIVAFIGPCRVELSEMVDLEDVLAQDWIYSPRMLHFIIEIFHLDLEKMVIIQRLFIAIIKEQLEYYGVKGIKRKGDDLYLENKKLSVSIATLSPVSCLIHTGLNLETEGTPVATVGLRELGIENTEEFAEQVMIALANEVESIKLARCKVRGVN